MFKTLLFAFPWVLLVFSVPWFVLPGPETLMGLPGWVIWSLVITVLYALAVALLLEVGWTVPDSQDTD